MREKVGMRMYDLALWRKAAALSGQKTPAPMDEVPGEMIPVMAVFERYLKMALLGFRLPDIRTWIEDDEMPLSLPRLCEEFGLPEHSFKNFYKRVVNTVERDIGCQKQKLTV